METGTAFFIGQDIDITPMVRNDPFAQSQPDTRSLKTLLGVQTLKDRKDPFRKPGIDSDTIVDKNDLAI